MMIDLVELLNECVDALSVPTWDHKNRGEHLARIEKVLNRDTTPDGVKKLLRSAAAIFREQQKMTSVSLALEEQTVDGLELATRIQSEMDGSLPRFIYHGTIYERLSGISKEGLVPGKIPVWKDRHVPKHFTDSAVFFCSTWRAAMLWAESAQTSAKGARNGIGRTLAVIRLPASGFTLDVDPMANQPGCLMVKGVVPVKDAEIIYGQVQGFPKWSPLAHV